MKLDLIIRSRAAYDMVRPGLSPISVGVLNGRIVEIAPEITTATVEHLDLGNKVLLPGFNDAHCHTIWYGLTLQEIDCNRAKNMDELYQLLAEGAKAEGEWVLAAGFNQEKFGGYPDIETLDRISQGKSLLIRHTSGHSCIVNTRALERAGLSHQSSQSGGAIIRDDAGNFTGVLEEKAQSAVQALFLPRSESEMVRALSLATGLYASQGITSFSEAGIGGGWIGQSPFELAAYQEALETNQLHARAQLMPVSDSLHGMAGNDRDAANFGLDLGLRTGYGNDMLSIGPMKIFLDGSLLAMTSALSKEFEHGKPGNFGYFQTEPAQLTQTILDAAKSNWSIAAHALGDRAVELGLDALEEAISRYGQPRIPHRLEHGGVVTDQQLHRSIALGVRIVSQPGFIPTLGKQMRQNIGDRSNYSHRMLSYLQQGMEVAGSSDRPVADGAPLSVMQAMVQRMDEDGNLYGEDERLSAAQALSAYTRGSAVVTGSWDKKGSIELGKLADFVVLAQDPAAIPAAQIKDIEIDMTLLGGKITYQREGTI